MLSTGFREADSKTKSSPSGHDALFQLVITPGTIIGTIIVRHIKVSLETFLFPFGMGDNSLGPYGDHEEVTYNRRKYIPACNES